MPLSASPSAHLKTLYIAMLLCQQASGNDIAKQSLALIRDLKTEESEVVKCY
jgi:hypothetical protein